MKNFHLFVEGVKIFDVSKNYQCDVYDAFKIIKIINKKSKIKIIVSETKMHTDFVGSYFVNFIIDEYKMFMTFIDEAIDRAKAKFFASKNEVKGFLIHNCKSFIMKNHRLMLFVRTNNAKKYIVIENELQIMSVIIKFITAYYQYQNKISKRFNKTIIIIAKSILV